MITQHAADALYALVAQLPPKSIFVEVGGSSWDETLLLANAAAEVRGGCVIHRVVKQVPDGLYERLEEAQRLEYVKFVVSDEEEAADRYGDDAIAGLFMHSATQAKLIRMIWAWSQKIKLNGLLCGPWDEDSRVAILKETKGAFTRIGFDQSLWKIPLYSKR